MFFWLADITLVWTFPTMSWPSNSPIPACVMAIWWSMLRPWTNVVRRSLTEQLRLLNLLPSTSSPGNLPSVCLDLLSKIATSSDALLTSIDTGSIGVEILKGLQWWGPKVKSHIHPWHVFGLQVRHFSMMYWYACLSCTKNEGQLDTLGKYFEYIISDKWKVHCNILYCLKYMEGMCRISGRMKQDADFANFENKCWETVRKIGLFRPHCYDSDNSPLYRGCLVRLHPPAAVFYVRWHPMGTADFTLSWRHFMVISTCVFILVYK